MMKRIAVFASGSGTNAQNLVQFFNFDHPEKSVKISLILSNRPDAYVLERAKLMNIPMLLFHRNDFYPTHNEHIFPIIAALAQHQIDYIVLAGFLWLIPQYLLDAFPCRIVNIHPALLPRFGGKGMYGKYVHRAVVSSGETESGITIHLVDNQYDHGSTLFQARCRVESGETPESLAHKIHLLEQEFFPKVIDEWINGKPLQ